MWWSSISHLIKHHKNHYLFSEEQGTHTQPHETASWWANTICVEWEDAKNAPHSGATAITSRRDTHIPIACLSCVWGKPHHDMQADCSRSLNICSRWIFHQERGMSMQNEFHTCAAAHMCTHTPTHTEWSSVCHLSNSEKIYAYFQ
jgi:hypothetical protein